MNEFVPRGYLTLEKALEHFGRLKHADEWEAEKASSKREFQRLLFAADLSAEVLTDDGILHSLRSSIWGSVEAERIFETGRASISVGNEYFPAEVRGRVLIKQSSIDALFDGDSDEVKTGPSEIDDERRHKLNSNDREKSRQSPRHRIHVQTVINNIVAKLKEKEDGAIGPNHVVRYLLTNFSSKEPKRTGVGDCDFVYWDESGGLLRWRDRKNNNKHIKENTLPRYVTEANRSFG